MEENIEITAARAPGRARERREKRGQTVKRAGIQGTAERSTRKQRQENKTHTA